MRLRIFTFQLLLLLFWVHSSLVAQFGPYNPRGLGGGGALFTPAISPHNPNEFYVNCDMNDLFHTTNAGSAWDILDFREYISTVECAVQFSNNPLRRYGIEKRFVQNYTYILTSLDGGVSWDTLPSPNAISAQFVLIANPQRDSVFVINSANSIHFTNNNGTSYTTIYTAPTNADCHLAGAFFDGSNYYVCTNRGLLTSTNSGQSWSAAFSTGINLNNEEIFSFAGAKVGTGIRFLAVTAAPGNVGAGAKPSAAVNNTFKNVWGLTLGQSTWTSHTGSLQFPQYDKPMLVSMARNDTSNVYLGGYCKVWNFQAHTVFKSTNGGRQWTNTFVRADIVQPYDSTNTFNNNFISPAWWGYSNSDNQTNYWTVGQVSGGIGVDPNNSANLLIMNNSVIHRSTNGGSTWSQDYVNLAQTLPSGVVIQGSSTFSSSGLENTGAWDLVWADSLHLMAGYNDILATRSTDGGLNWSYGYAGLKRPTNPPGTHKDVAQFLKHPVTGDLYAAAGTTLGQGGLYIDAYVDPRIGSVMTSTDMGATWTTIKNFQHIVSAITLDPANPNRMYAAVCNYAGTGYPGAIYVCNDISQGAASVWDTLAIPLGTEGRPNFIQVLVDGTLLAGYGARDLGSNTFNASSGVFYSTDNGFSWLPRSANGMKYSIRSITVDPSDASDSTWWACTHAVNNGSAQAGLWRTTDRGQNWSIITNTVGSANTVAFDPLLQNTAWLATERNGLYEVTHSDSTAPVLRSVMDYPYLFPWKVQFNPYDPGEMWVSSFGNGLRVSKCNMAQAGVANNPLVCTGDPSLDLFGTLAGEDSGGTWLDLNNSGALTGSILDPALTPSGIYNFRYIVGDRRCIDSVDVAVIVNALPVVSFTGLDTTYCSNEPAVTLVASPPGGTFTGPGTNGILFDPSVPSPGTATVQYTYVDGNNCTASQSQITTIWTAPSSSFSTTMNGFLLNCTFTGSNANTWYWDFGDGSFSTVASPTHTYASSGTFHVCLTTNNGTCNDTTCTDVNAIVIGAAASLGNAPIIFPNPGQESLHIQWMPQPVSVCIEVADALGRQVFSELLDGRLGGKVVEMNRSAIGIYQVRVRIGDQSWSTKWVKE